MARKKHKRCSRRNPKERKDFSLHKFIFWLKWAQSQKQIGKRSLSGPELARLEIVTRKKDKDLLTNAIDGSNSEKFMKQG